jgi:GNAT superfamily N-acetyltransferase
MKIEASVETPVFDSFRVRQMAGMFDLALQEKSRCSFSVEVPGVNEPWSIGLIVGPSGSGKSTVAREAFGDDLYEAGAWPQDAAVVDGFGPAPPGTREITQMLTAVGFSSPPAWVRPYAVLSNGEKFRCDLARALLSDRPVVVFDEFTSVVDRTVAKIGSAAVAKAIRNARIKKRFVAVSCHYDIADWLEPDWVVDMATQSLARGRLCRPRIALEIVRCTSAAWPLFARHHYLTPSLGCGFACYLACWNDNPVAFVAVAPLVGFKGRWRISRIVVLPDYQGIGIGMRVLNAVARLVREEGKRVNIVTSHPAMIRGLAASAAWRCVNIAPAGRVPRTAFQKRLKPATGRAVVSFELI